MLIVGLLLFASGTADAYVGPGAGFAFVSSFFILIFTMFLAFLTMLTWPFRLVMQRIRGRKAHAASRVQQVVILGLDGQDPELTQQFMNEGLLPNFSRLKEKGTFLPLETTLLAESPVAWTSFQTGCNPGKHRIFDFLVPNRKSYLPELSSAKVSSSKRTLSIGRIRIPIGNPNIQGGRRSQTFWKILGAHGIFSTILRVPITFPPEKFNGVMLSAMSVPDLKGTQGTYYYFTSDPLERIQLTSGERFPIEFNDGTAKGVIHGPENTLSRTGGEMHLPFEIKIGKGQLLSKIQLAGKTYPLKLKDYTPWIPLGFRAGPGIKVQGIVRFYLLETSPHVKLYMTPINIDPEKPALPISYPFTYAIYLAKTQGRYSTLGLAEDTSALNENVVDEDAFLAQTYLIHQERERMFFDALNKTTRGATVCVFDITDRLQHMFFRHLDRSHPANRGRNVTKHRDAIKKLYRDMDDLVGRTMNLLDDKTVLIVMSDHGFKSFRRGVNLNSWLHQNGFLAVKHKPTGTDMFQDVDWENTKAYAVGFGGIYLNVVGREAQGTVTPGEAAESVKLEIREGLQRLYDEKEDVYPVKSVYDSKKVYTGPYVSDAPDLIVGFRPGHRVAWGSVTGSISDEIIEDNDRYWSGDHNFNPPDVPGMFFCNWKIATKTPSILDLGPTVLDLFGVPIPPYCDGKSLIPKITKPKVISETSDDQSQLKQVAIR